MQRPSQIFMAFKTRFTVFKAEWKNKAPKKKTKLKNVCKRRRAVKAEKSCVCAIFQNINFSINNFIVCQGNVWLNRAVQRNKLSFPL